MSRWTSRVRRAAVALLGIHLLQVILLAAGAACEPLAAQGTAHHLLPVASVSAPGASEVADHGAHQHGAHADPAAVAPEHSEGPSERGHGPQHATCPMAMSCAATAVMTRVPSLPVHEVTLASRVLSYETGAPDAARPAPEPPPPRA